MTDKKTNVVEQYSDYIDDDPTDELPILDLSSGRFRDDPGKVQASDALADAHSIDEQDEYNIEAPPFKTTHRGRSG